MTITATSLHGKISALVEKIRHPSVGDDERAVAQRMLERLRARAAERGEDTTTSPDWSDYYRLPDEFRGSKYEGWIPAAELTRRIRKDIKFARDFAKEHADSGGVAVSDPIGEAPACIRINVRKDSYSGGRSVYINVKGVPADWWTEGLDWDDKPVKVPGPRLRDLARALDSLMWSYNRDRSDSMTDLFDRDFYGHVAADGHGEGDYTRDINLYHL